MPPQKFSIKEIFESPIFIGIIAWLIYALFASQAGPIWRTTDTAYFNYLADAFLRGQLHLRLMPTDTHDLTLYHGNYYLYWPPFPAILLMPFVALFGVNFSDVLFTLTLAAINVGLVFYFLRQLSARNIISTQPWQRFLITIVFALGSVHLILARWGTVWFTSQIVALTCGLLAYIAVIRFQGPRAFFLGGLFLSLAALTRTPLVLLGIWPAYYLYKQHKNSGVRKLIRYFSIFSIPILISLATYALYNQIRFGNAFDIGIGGSYRDMGAFFKSDFLKYGHFSLHYVPINFYYNFIFYPFPLSEKTFMGGSLFLLTPAFIVAFWGFSHTRPKHGIGF